MSVVATYVPIEKHMKDGVLNFESWYAEHRRVNYPEDHAHGDEAQKPRPKAVSPTAVDTSVADRLNAALVSTTTRPVAPATPATPATAPPANAAGKKRAAPKFKALFSSKQSFIRKFRAARKVAPEGRAAAMQAVYARHPNRVRHLEVLKKPTADQAAEYKHRTGKSHPNFSVKESVMSLIARLDAALGDALTESAKVFGKGHLRSAGGKFSSLRTKGHSQFVPQVSKVFRERCEKMGAKVKLSGAGGIVLVFEDLAKSEKCFCMLMSEGTKVVKHDIPGILFIASDLTESANAKPINWSNKMKDKEPAGLTPNQTETGYYGRTSHPVHIPVDDFLRMNPKRDMDERPSGNWLRQHAAAGGEIAHPVLVLADHPSRKGEYVVDGHEGRGRGMLAKELGHGTVPVQFRFRGESGRNKYNTAGRTLIVHPDERGGTGGPMTVPVPPHPETKVTERDGSVFKHDWDKAKDSLHAHGEQHGFKVLSHPKGGHVALIHKMIYAKVKGQLPSHSTREMGDHVRVRTAGAKVEDILPGGKGDGKTDDDFDAEQVEMGMKVEMEHTSDPAIAHEIVMDHLAENPAYYSKLKKAGLADELTKAESIVARLDAAIGEGTDEDFTQSFDDSDEAEERAKHLSATSDVDDCFYVLAFLDAFIVLPEDDAQERLNADQRVSVHAIYDDGEEKMDNDGLAERHSVRSKFRGKLNRKGGAVGIMKHNRNARMSARSRLKRGAIYAARKAARKALHHPDSH